MGKREVGRLGIIDLIISILIAELSAMSIDRTEEPLLKTILPITILMFLQIIFSYLSLKSVKLRTVLDGKPSILINSGELNVLEMKKQRYNLDDLMMQLREQGIRSIEEVEYAILESSGKLSLFKYESKKTDFPLPIVLDGEVQLDTLKYINKKDKWLYDMLRVRKIKLEDVFYAFNKGNDIFIILKSN